MLDHARRTGFAFPAFNIHDLFTANAVIEGFAAAHSDGIVQIHPSAGQAVSGTAGDPCLGTLSLAHHCRRICAHHDVWIAIHTDHCDTRAAPGFLDPLLDDTARRRSAGQEVVFTSHMFDGSDLALAQNLARSLAYLQRCQELDLWLEIEVGVVGSEQGEQGRRVFSDPEDFAVVRQALGPARRARYTVAPAFGNAHGVYRPGEVTLHPEVLARCQERVRTEYGDDFYLVFHGGSGSTPEEIRAAIEHGVVKMNFDTDGQYAFTRGIADYVFKEYDRILRIDGDPGERLAYFAETVLGRGQERMREFVISSCALLGSAENTLCTPSEVSEP